MPVCERGRARGGEEGEGGCDVRVEQGGRGGKEGEGVGREKWWEGRGREEEVVCEM